MKSEIYTLRHLPSVVILTILAILMAGVGSTLQWSLPFLLKIDPPQAGDGPAGQQVQALIGASNPANPNFQLAALDITGSGQSSGISIFIIAIVALATTAASYAFSSGAVVWKVVESGSRIKWALSLVTAAMGAVALVCLGACLLNGLIALVAAPLNDVALVAPVTDIAITWLRGILAVSLLAAAIIGVVLAVRKVGLAIGIVVAVVMLGVIFGTVGAMAGWDPLVYSWLPTSAVTVAGGRGLTQTLSPWFGVGALAVWASVSLGIGLSRFSRANL